MKIMKKLVACALATATAICCIPTLASATTTPHCDVNGDGNTDWADSVALMQYIAGRYSVSSPEEADFDNDGFVTEVDSDKLMTYLVTGNADIDAEESLDFNTNLNNCYMSYRKYSATTGNLIGAYGVPAASNIQSSSSTYSVIGSDTRYTDFSHKGICKIYLDDETVKTGFVVGDDLVLTAGNVVKNHRITSVQLFNTNGTIRLTTSALNYSIPSNYIKDKATDYALIKVNTSLPSDSIFDLGYALEYAKYANKAVSLTGFSSSNSISTGQGILKVSGGNNELVYSCDAGTMALGSPVYTDVIRNGEHHYVVVGIHTSDAEGATYNSGVRICPNITNLIRYNS